MIADNEQGIRCHWRQLQVLITVQGEVARAYVLLRTLQEQLANAQANVELQQRSLDIAAVRNRNGLTTELDVQQSLALLRDTQSLIPMLTTAIRRIKNVLSGWVAAERAGRSGCRRCVELPDSIDPDAK